VNQAQFLETLTKPLTKEHTDLLKQLHDTEVGSCEHFEEHFPMILPLDLYLTLEKRRKEKREKENMESPSGNPQLEQCRVLVAECEHIHNKVLFDCINDSLLQFKPYGKEGEPLPWQRKNRRLKPTDDFSVNEIFEIVKHDVSLRSCSNPLVVPVGHHRRRNFASPGVCVPRPVRRGALL
jgi:hypothetical protein